MKELLRTNNFVYLSYAQAVLKEAGIDVIVFDSHMSVMEGSLGVLPRRLMVADDDVPRARRILSEAEPLGVAGEFEQDANPEPGGM